MKYLIAFLLTINLHAAFCSPELVEDINLLTVNDRIGHLLNKTYPLMVRTSKKAYEQPLCIYETLQDEEGEDYQSLTNSPCIETQAEKDVQYYYSEPVDENDLSTLFERMVTKTMPEMSVLEAELASWKTKKINLINLENRVCAIKHRRESMTKCGYNIPNIKKFMRKIFKNKNLTKISCLESKEAEIDSENQAREDKDNEFKGLKTYFKNYDCSTLGDFNNKVCKYIKHKK